MAARLLGSGTFGAVVAPALPNIDEAGNTITFGDGYVTKLMFNKTDYDEAMGAANRIARNVPSLAFNMLPYKREITDANVSAIPGVQEYIDKYQPSHTRIYAMRMPNLGYALHDILQDDTEGLTNLRRRLRLWSNEEICGQVLKLMRIVRDIHNAGYVHADIRETNVMCNLDTKDFTIVDFDWFMPMNEFIARYPNYYYSHPPEGLYMLRKPNRLDGIRALFVDGTIPDPDMYRSRLNTNIHIWLNTYKSNIDAFIEDGLNSEIAETNEFARQLKYEGGHLRELVTEHGVAEGQRLYRKKYLATVDSYGLAVGLLPLFEAVLTLPHQAELRTFLVGELLPAMMRFRLKNRLTIDEAIARFEEFLAEHMPAVKADLDLEDEIQRLRAIRPDVVEVPMPRQRRLSSTRRSALRKQVEGYAALMGAMKGIHLPSTSPRLSGLLPMLRSPSGRTASSSRLFSNSLKVSSPSSSTKSRRKTVSAKTVSANKKKSSATTRSDSLPFVERGRVSNDPSFRRVGSTRKRSPK
jgi:hypothetical protein